MLPQHNRIRQSRDFSRVYRHGQKAVSKYLVVRVLAHPQPHPPGNEPLSLTNKFLPVRIGITVSQKVSKRAVVRNQLKRRVRAALRELLPQIKSGLWLVINLRPEAVQCEYAEILRELEELLTKLEVIHGHS
jgi:ribonuclease P protein component